MMRLVAKADHAGEISTQTLAKGHADHHFFLRTHMCPHNDPVKIEESARYSPERKILLRRVQTRKRGDKGGQIENYDKYKSALSSESFAKLFRCYIQKYNILKRTMAVNRSVKGPIC